MPKSRAYRNLAIDLPEKPLLFSLIFALTVSVSAAIEYGIGLLSTSEICPLLLLSPSSVFGAGNCNFVVTNLSAAGDRLRSAAAASRSTIIFAH